MMMMPRKMEKYSRNYSHKQQNIKTNNFRTNVVYIKTGVNI